MVQQSAASPSLAAALRARHNWEQLAKFCAVGAVGYGINLAVYAVLLHAGLHYLVAATLSFLVAVTSNYVWNRLWTFREHRGHLGIQGMRFFLVSVAALGANLVVVRTPEGPAVLRSVPCRFVPLVAGL